MDGDLQQRKHLQKWGISAKLEKEVVERIKYHIR